MKEKKRGANQERIRVSQKTNKPSTETSSRDRGDSFPRLTGASPELNHPEEVLALQRTVGNKTVSDLLDQNITDTTNATSPILRVDEEEVGGGEGPSAGGEERARELFQEGSELVRQGQLHQAIIRFERARQADPSLRNTYWNIAECNLTLGRNATAIIYYEQYMAMPGAEVEAAQERLREARRLAGVAEDTPVTPQTAEEPDGDVPGVGVSEEPGEEAAPTAEGEARARELFREGSELVRQGQLRQAIIRFERARQADPSLRNTYWNIAECNMTLGRNATAIIYYEHYMSMPGADTAAAQERLREVRELAGVEGETPVTPLPAEEPDGEVPQRASSTPPSEEAAPTS